MNGFVGKMKLRVKLEIDKVEEILSKRVRVVVSHRAI